MDADEDLLGEILREATVADHSKHVVVDGPLVGADDDRERLLIAPLGLPKDVLVRLFESQRAASIQPFSASTSTIYDSVKCYGAWSRIPHSTQEESSEVGLPYPDVMYELLAGGCLCGAVRFEVTEPPLFAGYCHCSRCQRRTGAAASVSARMQPGSLRILTGEEHITVYQAE